MQEFIIGANEAGQRLDKFLHKYLKEAGTGFLYKMLRKKNITLNKKKAEGKEVLQSGDRVQFFFSEESFEKFRGNVSKNQEIEKSKKSSWTVSGRQTSPFLLESYLTAYQRLKGMDIVFENQHVILLNKPAGILSQKSSPSDISVNEWLIGYLLSKKEISPKQLETFKPSICNRLDRNTSGLIICSKSFLGSQCMNELIRTRKIRKFYRTFVKGKVEQGAYLKGYLRKEAAENKVFLKETISSNETKEYVPIETAYQPLSYPKDGYTYLEVELMTGKPHQIRAHLASIGHPILGDEKYGDKKWNQSFSKIKLPNHQLLHAYRVEFPIMDKEFESLSGKKIIAEEPQVYKKLK